nr:hypothetical protein CFP56_64018 [Quercus suber]
MHNTPRTPLCQAALFFPGRWTVSEYTRSRRNSKDASRTNKRGPMIPCIVQDQETYKEGRPSHKSCEGQNGYSAKAGLVSKGAISQSAARASSARLASLHLHPQRLFCVITPRRPVGSFSILPLPPR